MPLNIPIEYNLDDYKEEEDLETNKSNYGLPSWQADDDE